MRKAIAMLSLGDRPWSKLSFYTFQMYADKVGADAIFINNDIYQEEFALGSFELTKKRVNKRAYALKSYIPWKLMQEGYDRVAMVDDSCSVHPYADSIFDQVPAGHIGYTKTSAQHAQISFDMIKKFQELNHEQAIMFNSDLYANSGVVVYDKQCMHAFSPDEIIRAKPLLYNDYPHQTLLYYLINRHDISVIMMPKKYNSMPAMNLNKEDRKNLDNVLPHLNLEKIWISHFSGAYRNRNRLINQTSEYFIELWNKHGFL